MQHFPAMLNLVGIRLKSAILIDNN